jgi:glycerophosphoryl diester phosphodiesterase
VSEKVHRFFRGLAPTLHIAHRGGAALAPENTIEACRLAREEHRTEMFELDLQLTADGVLVVTHDDTVDRCTDGCGRVDAMTAGEIQRLDAGFRFDAFRGRGVRIPTLVEMLRAFPEMRMNVELKPTDPRSAEVLAETLRAEGAVERMCCGSVHDPVALRVAELLPEACRFFPEAALRRFVLAALQGQPIGDPGPWHVLDMPLYHEGVRLIAPPLLETAREAGVWINVWTVDDPAEMARLRDEGVGGIMSDRPDLLRQVLGPSGNL